jgi:hypothetical protein
MKGKGAKGQRGRKSKDDVFDDPETCLGPEKSPLYEEETMNSQVLNSGKM